MQYDRISTSDDDELDKRPNAPPQLVINQGQSSTSADTTSPGGNDGSPIAVPSTPATRVNKPVTWSDLPRKGQLSIITIARVSEPLVQTSLQVRPSFHVNRKYNAEPRLTN